MYKGAIWTLLPGTTAVYLSQHYLAARAHMAQRGQRYPAAQSVMDAEAWRAFEDAAESVIDPVGGAGR